MQVCTYSTRQTEEPEPEGVEVGGVISCVEDLRAESLHNLNEVIAEMAGGLPGQLAVQPDSCPAVLEEAAQ